MQTVQPTLRSKAKIALVGENPSRQDATDGGFFRGHAGRVLDKALGLANLSRDDCTLTAVVKEVNSYPIAMLGKPPEFERSQKMLDWMKLLKTDLSLRRPNVAMALGEEALYALTNKRGITKYRGSILPSTLIPGLKVIPAFSPQWVMRGQFQHFWSLVGDLSRAEKQSHFPELNPPKWTSITAPGLTQVLDFIKGIPDDAKWSLDIETRAHQLACFSIAYARQALCVPIQNPGGPAFFPSHEAAIWKVVSDLMQRNPYLVGQNLTFDLEYLFDYGLEPSGIWMDTMLSHAVLYPEFPKGLDFLCALYTEMPYYKSEGKITNPKLTTQDLWTYNNKDTITTLWCAEAIERELRKRGLWPTHEFVTKEIGLALEMQRNHLRVDQTRRAELKALLKVAEGELREKWEANYSTTLTALAGDAVLKPNVNSPKQVAEFIYGHLKLPKKTRDGSIVADETALNELKAAHPGVPELDWILTERHLRKLNSSYLDVVLEPDGTLGGSWCVHGTETGRWSSGKNARGRGLNLQTVPKAVRWMVVP